MTWTAPEITRDMRPLAQPAGDERALADAWLDLHRETLLWKCGGLTASQLKLRAVEPSGLSPARDQAGDAVVGIGSEAGK